jgi:hypothetical protein
VPSIEHWRDVMAQSTWDWFCDFSLRALASGTRPG